MLTADLVRARLRKGVLTPEYVSPLDAELVGLAQRLIEIFARNVGRTQRNLNADLKDFLGTGTTFLLHRGLAKLLRDRCEFATVAAIEPEELRRSTFLAAAAAYCDGDGFHFDRDAVCAGVCTEHGIDADTFEQGLYADLKDEQQLVDFKNCDPDWLLDRYNVALAQAALLRATSMRVRVRHDDASRYRELFRWMKFCRLLYDVEVCEEGGYDITLDGPLAMFKASSRYGVQMAQFLPVLLHFDEFALEATVLHGPKRREVKFELEATRGLRPISRLRGQWRPEEVDWLVDRFRKLDCDWSISESSEVVDLGEQGILIADHVFTHEPSATRVYLEILGYWRRGSLATRLEVLRAHGPANMILAVSKELHVDDEDIEDLPGEVVVFRVTPIARDILAALERIVAAT